MTKATVILMGNQKGGVGKSTITVTLSTGLKMLGHRVLVLDTDPQQSVASWRASAQGLEHEQDLPWVERADNELIAEKIKRERANYDFILIDSASNLGQRGDSIQKVLRASITAADLVIIPMGPSQFDVMGSADFVEIVNEIWARHEKPGKAGYIVINGVRAGTKLGAEVAEYVAEVFGENYSTQVLGTRLQMREGYKQALFQGESIFQLKEPQAIANAKAFVDEVLAIAARIQSEAA